MTEFVSFVVLLLLCGIVHLIACICCFAHLVFASVYEAGFAVGVWVGWLIG